MTSNTQSHEKKLTQLQKAIAALSTVFPPKTTLQLMGQSLTPAQIAATFTAAVTAVQAVSSARAQLTQLITSQAAALTAADTLLQALKAYLTATFGKRSPQLAAFGFSTAAPKTPSAETKAASAAKAKLTRQAHGTNLGKRQKAAVTVEGAPGLVLYGPDGKPIPGVTKGPTPPANSGNGQAQ